jgi:hypothetical protein
LDLEGVYYEATWGNDESKEASNGDIEYTLEGVQESIVLMTPLKYNS